MHAGRTKCDEAAILNRLVLDNFTPELAEAIFRLDFDAQDHRGVQELDGWPRP
jgi:hypothetical protein